MGPNRLAPDKFGLIRNWICPSCQSKKVNANSNSFSTVRIGSSLSTRSKPRAVTVQDVSFQRVSARKFSATISLKAAPPRQPKLPDGPARTRFAPSPTGYLHIGGLRTALFSYLLAKRTGGQFLLRIEDTDQKRLVRDAESKLCNDLQWAGLQWDEGPEIGGPYGPYRQSERNQIYQDHSCTLLDEGSAYRCFCTQQSNAQTQAAYVTSGCYQNCSSLSADESQNRAEDKGEAFTVRLHPPQDAPKQIYKDLVYGKIQRLKRSPAVSQASEDDNGVDASDTILMKSDGTPTYHFANVVDDHLMKVTHVIRGLEWMASTPLHYDIYSAFGWQPPEFAHVGLLVDQNKAKLSKRNQDLALDVSSMRDEHGILPDTLDNFLALLGWSNPTDNDVMDMDALIRNFDMKFTRGNTMVRMEKLWYLQKQHVALRCQEAQDTKSLLPIKDIVPQITQEVRRVFSDPYMNADLFSEVYYSEYQDEPDTLEAYCTEILLADSKSYQNARQFVERNRYFFDFDSAQLPKEKQFYNTDQTMSGLVLQMAMDDLLSSGEIKAVAEEPLSVQPLERQFHAALAEAVWRGAAAQFQPFQIPFDSANSTDWEILRALDLSVIQQANPVADVETHATALLEASKLPNHINLDRQSVIDLLVRRYKILNGALMKYLREKLAYGLPGPSMSMVMTLLGYDECCRRLSGARDAGNF